MSAAARQLADAVRRALGDKAVVTDAADIAPWLTDWRGRWHGQAAAILQPATTAEVVTMMQMAAAAGVPLVPQGGNSSMVGGATPPADGSALIVSLRRMNRVRSLDPATNRAVVEAGVILEHFHGCAAAAGRRFPLTLGARGSATMGGLASTNAGGTQVLRFGTMRALVDGVEAVLPDGTIHDGLTGLKKDNRGYSFDQLLIGAEGTLAIITALRVKLVPAVAARAVAWLGLASPDAALAVLRALETATDTVEGFEILPDESLGAVLSHIPATRAPLAGPHRWHALIEATAHSLDDEPPATLLERLLVPLIEAGTVEDATIAASEAQADALWRIRDSLSEAERAVFGPATQHDISVAVERMPGFMAEAAAAIEARWPGVHASGFGHLGDGNIHFHVRAGARATPGWIDGEGADVAAMVHRLVSEAGGSISAEHGIGQMKRDTLALLEPQRVAHLKAIKSGLDPAGLMNPGKLV